MSKKGTAFLRNCARVQSQYSLSLIDNPQHRQMSLFTKNITLEVKTKPNVDWFTSFGKTDFGA